MLLSLGLSVVIGLLLGLLGGGGSILTVPMLVYMLHVEPKSAIVTSFVVVGVSSLMAMIPHALRGSVCWKSGVFFGLAGMAGAFGGGRLASHFSGDLLMAVFGLITLLTGAAMLVNKRGAAPHAGQVLAMCPLRVPYPRLLFDGFFVGCLTGLVGVGGGFLIVPALTLLVGLSMPAAIGTSLLVIVMNSVAGLSGYASHVALDVPLTAIVTGGAVFGSLLGALLSKYVSPAALRRGFGGFVILVATYILSHAITPELWKMMDDELMDRLGMRRLFTGLLVVALLLLIGSRIHHRAAGGRAVDFSSDDKNVLH